MTTGRYLYRYFCCSGKKVFLFLALEFQSQNTQTFIRTWACVLETYVRSDIGHIYIYIAQLIIEHQREWLASLANYPARLHARVKILLLCNALDYNQTISHIIFSQIFDTSRCAYCSLSDQYTDNSSS